VPLNQWTHVVGVWDGQTARVYANGILHQSATCTTAPASNANTLRIGHYYSTACSFNGLIDEVRVSAVARSAEWISTAYNNQAGVGSFARMEGEETVTGGTGVVTLGAVLPRRDSIKVRAYVELGEGVETGTLGWEYREAGASEWIEAWYGEVTGSGYYGKDVSGLSAETEYEFRAVLIVGGARYEGEVLTFRTGAGFISGWTHRRRIVIDHTKVAGDLVNFPVLVAISDANDSLFDIARDDGHDILFTAESGLKLSHEIEEYDAEGGRLVAWVKVPELSSSEDTVLYLYYGNPESGDQSDGVGVWDDGYRMVQHLEEDPSGAAPQVIDSTGNRNDGVSYGGMTSDDLVSCMVDGGLDFDGTNDYIDCGNKSNLNITGPFTIEAWVKPRQVKDSGICDKYSSYGLRYGSSGVVLQTQNSTRATIHRSMCR